MRIKAGILALLVLAAGLSVAGALGSMRRLHSPLTQELMERFSFGSDKAEYYLRGYNGYVAVFSDKRSRTPEAVTDIELSGLRSADAALMERGVGVSDKGELLALLEDLGS